MSLSKKVYTFIFSFFFPLVIFANTFSINCLELSEKSFFTASDGGFITEWGSDGIGKHYQVSRHKIKDIKKNPCSMDLAIYESDSFSMNKVFVLDWTSLAKKFVLSFEEKVTLLSYSQRGSLLFVGTEKSTYIFHASTGTLINEIKDFPYSISLVKTGLSEKNAEKVSERIDTVYVGLARHRKSTEYQLSASCDFPKAALSAAFSKKNGWKAEPLFLPDADGKKVGYTIYDNSAVQVSFPSSDIVCAGRAVPLMVEQFHDRVNSLPLETDSPLLPDVHSWLEYEGGLKNEEIRFFAAKPQSFLTMLTGAQLNFQLVYVRGIMENDPLNDRQFRMQLEFEFRDKRLVPAARGALTVAFGLTDSEVLRETETHLTIRNIKINKNQLYGILVL